MNHELLLFFCSMGAGASLLFIYDWIRILRKLIPHKSVTVAVVDFCYWIAGGIYIFAMMYQKNDGIIRSYAMLGILTGMALYHFSISEAFVKLSVKVIGFPIKIVKKPLKRLRSSIIRVKITIYAFVNGHRESWKKRLDKVGKGKSHKESEEK